jgi:hypothetical protein
MAVGAIESKFSTVGPRNANQPLDGSNGCTANTLLSRNEQRQKSTERLERYRKAGRSGSTTVEGCGQSDVSRAENGSQHWRLASHANRSKTKTKPLAKLQSKHPETSGRKSRSHSVSIPRVEKLSTRAQETHREARRQGRWRWYETKRAPLACSARVESLSIRQ